MRLPQRLTAPESVGRRCAQLRRSGADFALGPRLVHGALAFWMQTTGTALGVSERRSIVRLRTPAQDSRSAHGLLYLAAVRDDSREQERCQVGVGYSGAPSRSLSGGTAAR
jgi:hypothetical protein